MKTLVLHPSGRWIDTTPVNFHGYTVHYGGYVASKRDSENFLATSKRMRRGKLGKYDVCVTLHYNGGHRKWTLSRLIGACFLGAIDGMEMNHLDRDPTNNDGNNLTILTKSENQQHWRKDSKKEE